MKKKNPVWKIVDRIIKDWHIRDSDKGKMFDIEAAMTEAYMQGAYDASKDKKLIEKAIDFIEPLPQISS